MEAFVTMMEIKAGKNKGKRRESPKKVVKQKPPTKKKKESPLIEGIYIKTMDSQIFDRGQEKIDQLASEKAA